VGETFDLKHHGFGFPTGFEDFYTLVGVAIKAA
jgi:hypothetical protein